MNDPSNSIPYSEERVTGENNDQKILYEMFATRKREIPEPRPYPDLSIESSNMTTTPANKSWAIIKEILTAPKVEGGP